MKKSLAEVEIIFSSSKFGENSPIKKTLKVLGGSRFNIFFL
jgi:hypothetical protein